MPRTLRPLALLLAATALALAAAPGAEAAHPSRRPVPAVAVAPQYDTTHVYVPADGFDRFVSSFVATFGGTTSPRGEFTVTPTPSLTLSQLVMTPVGTLSVFGFRTPVPYPFGAERTGYLVTDMDAAVAAARASGADVLVAPFPDPIGRDAIVQWPGGVNMQLYWHTTTPHYAPLATLPENRVYVSPLRADAFVRAFLRFSHGVRIADERAAPGADIGRPGETFRRVRLTSAFGRLTVLATDGKLPWPFGREMTGYEVTDLDAVIARAREAGAVVRAGPYVAGDRRAALVEFPGGYIAEVHAPAAP